MRARQLLAGGVLNPDQLKVIYTAFDGAWEIIKPEVSRNPRDRELARLKLAEALLRIQTVGQLDVVRLRDQAVHLFHREQ